MAWRYYDYTNSTSSSTSSTGNVPYWTNTSNATESLTGGTSTWSDTTNVYYYIQKPKKYLVLMPKHWTDADEDSFVRLVNVDTATGWRVELLIRGDVVIADPDIEVREMEAFRQMWRLHAGGKDRATIDEFFKTHPTTAPDSDTGEPDA